jgi:hypothetical protein
MMRILVTALLTAALTLLPACNRANIPAAGAAGVSDATPVAYTSATEPEQRADRPAYQPRARVSSAQEPVLLPGSSLRVRLLETLDTERNRPGDRFTATLDEPLVSGDRVIVPKGTVFTGRVTQAKRSGRFKGRAVLALNLDSFEWHGRTYALRTTTPARVSGGHKKRNWLWLGGGSGGGALIGAAAGGGVGALIGSGAGAAAGTAGMLITGRKDVRLPVESTVTFTLQSRVNLTS